MGDGDGIESVQSLTPMFLDPVDSAEHAKVLAEQPPQKCVKMAATVARPPNSDPFGCPAVEPKDFQKTCLSKSRPCVLRGAGAGFLRNHAAQSALDRWVELAGNSTVKVSIPFPSADSGGLPTLNSIRRTEEFFLQESVRDDLKRRGKEAPNAQDYPWTLVRGGRFTMQLRDAVTWTRQHPQKST